MDKPHLYYIVFDWETGGLSAKKNLVTELAMVAIRADNFEEIGRIDNLVLPYDKKGKTISYDFESFLIKGVKKDNPNFKKINEANSLIEKALDFVYTEGALNSTGIDGKLIQSKGIDLPFLVDKIIDLANSAKVSATSKAVLVGHNPEFDRNFLQQVFTITGKAKELPKIFAGSEDYYGNFQPHMIDTIDLAKLAFHKNENEILNYKLSTCVEKAGLDLVGAHRAINDVISTKDLLFYFKNKLRSTITTESRTRDNFKFEY